MMISRIIQNNHHLFSSGTMADQVFQTFTKSFSIELFPLLGQPSSVPQMNRPIASYLLMGRGLPEDRISNLRRNPHHISRPMLLKMALIQAPKIKIVPSYPLPKFSYMPLVLLGFLLQSLLWACVCEIPAGEKDVDTTSSHPSNQISDRIKGRFERE